MTSYEEMDKLRKDYHDWLKERIHMVQTDTPIVDKRIFTLVDALLGEIDFLSIDFSDRTKTLLEQTNFLWAYTRILSDVVFLGKKIERIEPVTEQVKKFEEEMNGLLSMKEQIDSQIKGGVNEIRNQIDGQKKTINKDLPGVA